MASQIATILTEIAAWTPTYDTESVGCWNIDAVRPNLEPASTPKRILGLDDDNEFGFVALGKRGSIIWRITDTLYIAPTGEMAVMRRHYGDMIRYIASYINAALNDRGMASNLAHVVSVKLARGTYAWPEGSGNLFLGVRAELEIQEII